MSIYVHKDVLGFQQHLIIQNNGIINKTKEIPNDQALVFGDPELTEIAKVYGLAMPEFPLVAYQTALGAVLGANDQRGVPWVLTMPPKAFKRSIEALAESLWATFSKINLDYYLNHYKETVSLLNQMEPAKIDPRAWMVHTNNPNLVTPHVLRTFEPDSLGFASKTCYSKNDTKTGRLKVSHGPNILHLPKEQRNILGSRFGINGKIINLDFRALEPRVLLFINRLSSPLSGNVPRLPPATPQEDIYQEVLDSLGIVDIHRAKAKDVTLCQLYGAGHEKMLMGLDGVRDPEGFIEAVNDFFGLNSIRDRLFQEYEANDRNHILSFYGRPLDTSDAKPYMLLNYFIQSTAVDVALYGFRNIIRKIIGNPLIIPLFILHDALVLDVHNSAMGFIPELLLTGSRDIPMFPGCEFAIKASRF